MLCQCMMDSQKDDMRAKFVIIGTGGVAVFQIQFLAFMDLFFFFSFAWCMFNIVFAIFHYWSMLTMSMFVAMEAALVS